MKAKVINLGFGHRPFSLLQLYTNHLIQSGNPLTLKYCYWKNTL